MSDGIELIKADNFGQLDKKKLEALIEDGFGKELAKDYFDNLNPEAVYVAQLGGRYIGAIVLERTEMGIAYLDKYVVSGEFQHNGIGSKLWDEMIENENSKVGTGPRIFWRAKPDNKHIPSYMKKCDGMQKRDGWHVFWVGLNPEELDKAINYALAKRETLAKKEKP